MRKSTIPTAKGWRGVSAFLACLVVLAWSAPTPALDKVKTGYLPLVSFVPIFVAIDEGYFKEQNIELDLTRFNSGTHMLPALAIGEIDVASGGPGGPFYNAIAQNTGFKIVADKGRMSKGHSYLVLVVRKDILASGRVKSLKDIMTLKVGQMTKSSINAFVLNQMMKHEGLDYNKLDLTFLPPPKQFQALESKAIDAAMTVEPWAARAIEKGVATVFKTADDWLGDRDIQIAVIMYSGQFAKEKRDLAQRWMNAYLKGIAYHHSHGFQNDAELAIIGKWTKVPANIVRLSIPAYFSKDGGVNVESLEEAQDWYLAEGFTKTRVSMREAVDLSFLKK